MHNQCNYVRWGKHTYWERCAGPGCDRRRATKVLRQEQEGHVQRLFELAGGKRARSSERDARRLARREARRAAQLTKRLARQAKRKASV